MSDSNSADRDLGANERSQTVLQALADPVCTFDDAGQLRWVNEAFERETGYDAATACGSPLTLVVDESAADRIGSLVGTLVDDSERVTETLELELQTRNGERIPTQWHLSSLPAKGGLPGGGVAVLRNISDRKRREERLAEFASVVSHDLRNPLDVALGRAEVLPDIVDVDDDVEQHLDEIYNSLKRMEHLIEDVLRLTRYDGEIVETSPVSLESVTEDAWRHVDTGGATLSVTADGEVLAHRSRLLRLLENLFRNAIEHAGNDVSVEVGLDRVDRDSGTATLYVADDGPGVPNGAREQIFDDGFTTGRAGAGLGLAIVREIARAHGWTVEVTDSADGGARFEFADVTLPD